jgi:hypothetical protein
MSSDNWHTGITTTVARAPPGSFAVVELRGAISIGGGANEARQLSSTLLGRSRKLAMMVAKHVGAQRDALCPTPGKTRWWSSQR